MQGPSDRRFGIEIAAVLAALGALRRNSLLLAAACMLVALALVRPRWLSPLNNAWMRLAAVLQIVTSAIFFYVIFTPVALIARLTGRDPLRLKSGAPSYWLRREQSVTTINWHQQF